MRSTVGKPCRLLVLLPLFLLCHEGVAKRVRVSVSTYVNAAKAEEEKRRCRTSQEIPYLPKGPSRERLHEADIEDKCKGADTLGDYLLITQAYGPSVEWMLGAIPIPFMVYYVGGQTQVHRHENVGREAMGILTFIAEYYKCLPKVALFVHPHEESYHTFRPLSRALQLVQWDKVPGYATVNPHNGNWGNFNPYDPLSSLGSPLTPEEIEDRKWSREDNEIPCHWVCVHCDPYIPKYYSPGLDVSTGTFGLQIINGTTYDDIPQWEYRRAQYISKAWDTLFGKTVLGKRAMPDKMRMPLQAEFFVRRERILSRPRQFYLQAIHWVSAAPKADIMNEWEVGVVFELMWHYIFGEPAVMKGLTVKPCVLYKCDRPYKVPDNVMFPHEFEYTT